MFLNKQLGQNEHLKQKKPIEQDERQQKSPSQQCSSWYSEDEPISELLQSPKVSSTEKSYIYRTRFAVRRKLISESDDENKENLSNNINLTFGGFASPAITSSVDRYPYESIMSSEDEYVPDSADETTSSRDSNSSIEISNLPQIVVNLNNIKQFSDQDLSEHTVAQQDVSEQWIVNQNTNEQNISRQHCQEVSFNNESIQTDQNLIIQVLLFNLLN